MSRLLRAAVVACAVAVGTVRMLAVPGVAAATALDVAGSEREMATIEARWSALTQAPRRDAKSLADLQKRAQALAADVSRGLGALREEAAERDADMAAVVAGGDWQAAEALLLRLRFRIAAIELERALAGDPDKVRLARAAADGFAPFVDAPDATLAAEARYGRGLARVAAGERAAGLTDLRAAVNERGVAPRARLALAEALADGGDRAQALDVLAKLVASGGAPRDVVLRAQLLRLKLLVGATGKGSVPPRDLPAVIDALLAAGEPWRASALALLGGREDLLPAGTDAGPAIVLLRADAAARDGDAAAAAKLYAQAVEQGGATPDPAALDGLARAAFASGDGATARGALERLRATDRPWTRDLALLDLRTAYAAWQAAPDAASSGALLRAADAVARVDAATADDRAEAAYRKAEAARAAGDLDAAIASFAAIDAPAWQAPAGVAALQARVTRFARDAASEPRDGARESRDELLRDLGAALGRTTWPEDARAAVVVLDATVRTAPAPGLPALPLEGQRAALARVRELPARLPKSALLLPAALRSGALLELDVGEVPDVAAIAALDEGSRAAVAAAIAGDLREEALLAVEARTARAPTDGAAYAATDAATARGRRAITAALAFAALAPPAERDAGRLELAQAALALGDAQAAVGLFQAAADAQPSSLRALRGLALAAQASGDAALARDAWQRLAALPDLPPALREEAAAALAPAPAAR